MDNQYVIKSAFAMGTRDEKYGQTWYATVEELEVPVMFNLMSGSVQDMDRITFEEQVVNKFKSGKNMGKEYRRLRKVKVEEHAPRIENESSAPHQESKLEARVKKLEAAVFGEEAQPPAGYEIVEDTVVNDVPDGEIDLSEIPF